MQVPDFVKYYSVQLFSSLALAATRLFLPNLAKLLGTPLSLIGVISAASNVTVLASSFIFSRRTDIEGSKRYLHIGLLLSSVTAVLLFFSHDYLSLLVTFALAGFAMGSGNGSSRTSTQPVYKRFPFSSRRLAPGDP